MYWLVLKSERSKLYFTCAIEYYYNLHNSIDTQLCITKTS